MAQVVGETPRSGVVSASSAAVREGTRRRRRRNTALKRCRRRRALCRRPRSSRRGSWRCRSGRKGSGGSGARFRTVGVLVGVFAARVGVMCCGGGGWARCWRRGRGRRRGRRCCVAGGIRGRKTRWGSVRCAWKERMEDKESAPRSSASTTSPSSPPAPSSLTFRFFEAGSPAAVSSSTASSPSSALIVSSCCFDADGTGEWLSCWEERESASFETERRREAAVDLL